MLCGEPFGSPLGLLSWERVPTGVDQNTVQWLSPRLWSAVLNPQFTEMEPPVNVSGALEQLSPLPEASCHQVNFFSPVPTLDVGRPEQVLHSTDYCFHSM